MSKPVSMLLRRITEFWAFISDYFLSNYSYDLPFFRSYLYYFLLLFIMDEYIIIEIIIFTFAINYFFNYIYNYSLLINYDDLLFYTWRMTASLVSSGESKTAVNSNALEWPITGFWTMMIATYNKRTKAKKWNAAVTVAVRIKVLKQHRIPHNEQHKKEKKYC